MRIQTPPWLVAGPPPRRPLLPAPSADGHPRRTLVAARHARRPDHDRESDQPTERCHVMTCIAAPSFKALKGWHLVNSQHVNASLQKTRSRGRPAELAGRMPLRWVQPPQRTP
jgi:hypothetical protein